MSVASIPAAMSVASIPVIDMSPWLQEGQCGRADVVSKLSSAVLSHGIFAVVGHGIPEELIAGSLEASKEALEKAEMEDWARLEAEVTLREPNALPNFSCDENVGRGYNGDPTAPKESVSKFTVFPPCWDSDPTLLKGYNNIWPSTNSGQAMRGPLEDYFREVQRVSDALHRALSECLGRPSTFVDESLKPHTEGLLRACRYHCNEENANTDPALAAHKDLGTTTLLVSDAPGLQFLPRGSDVWVDVVLPPGAVIVNLGEFFEIWTGGAWRATPHRVSPAGRRGRTSLVFFSNQGLRRYQDGCKTINRIIEPLSDTASDANVESWQGVRSFAGEVHASVAWPAFWYERLNTLMQFRKGGA
eukprot:CAMPEP_0197627218 /NCGR_PEP_ID=MMETSP1338-20131121/5887_1 /TAXON_ID=43686 ORGANISM="Pelagodinium beii, Strain RCC1491" /NCGR_SAMPLE_ID=MMETSP1338 /ASSEMBLY_ACC=CAM_ASM_000754 /LENGTH=359 /DNA_ID=CAMNT_0043197877 /DNA_START=49 /DNA_END=1131 /DNA_ORIENTATION=+